MRIAIFLSTLGGSPLVVGLERGLKQLGHHVEVYRHGIGYDLILMFNQTSHNPSYVYPEFPPGSTPIAFIDSAEYGYFKRLPRVVEHYKNTFSLGSLGHDTKNAGQQLRLKEYLQGRSFPYFIREHLKLVEFPACYHPIDYPLYASSACPQEPDREEYLARSEDLFVSWGGSHPWRNNLTAVLRACEGVTSSIHVIGEGGAQRIPQMEYFRRTRAAKCSVSFDGYGSGSFRMTEVLVRALLLMGPLSIRTREPLIDGIHCVEYSVESDGETFLSTNLAEKLKSVIENPNGSFGIYRAGYWHCNQHYSERATAEYVLRTVSVHDYTKPTPLEW